MQRPKWSREPVPSPDGRGMVMADYHDLIPLASINKPVLIQQDPSVTRREPRFFVNPFVH